MLSLDDIDLFEINEAFAVVAEKFVRDVGFDRDKVNVNGVHLPRESSIFLRAGVGQVEAAYSLHPS